jgi:pullulanase
MVIYELHVRDFSRSMPACRRRMARQVPGLHRGRLERHAPPARAGAAGLTDVHLLPVFDIATVPERGCTTPRRRGAPDSEAQQAA